MSNSVRITNNAYQAFMYRDLETHHGIKKVDAAFTFNKRYKILDRRYDQSDVILVFETDKAATWFVLNLPYTE